MRKYNIPPAFSGSLQLGRQGENGVTEITFLCAGYAKMYGDGFAEAVHRTPDGTTYPVNIEQDEDSRVSWLISDGDTATAGTGQLELRWMVNGNLAKSKIFSTIIKSALTAPETPPDAAKSWVDKVLKAAEDIKLNGITEQKAREIAQSVVDSYQEKDPTVPDWAKAETKPTYTATEVGAVPESAKSDIDKNTSARHTHSNKSALDSISESDISKWNSGTAGTVEITGATGLAAGSAPTVTETADSTARARKYTLGIPAGENGADGAKGEKGENGTDGADGKSAYQFAQESGYAGTETDFSKKLNQTTFANPFPITFTGAASATYDGSSAVTVDLPSGGSSQDVETIKQDVVEIKEGLSNKITKFYASNQGETHVTDSDNGKMQDIVIYGKSSQEGTPTIENPVEIKSVVNPTVKVTNKDGLNVKSVTLNDITLNAIPVSSGGNVTIDGQQYVADYVDVERGKIVRMCAMGTFNTNNGKVSEEHRLSIRIKHAAKNGGKECIFSAFKWTSWETCANGEYLYIKNIKKSNNELYTAQELKELSLDFDAVYQLADRQETDLTAEQIQALNGLVTYYPTTSIGINSEQLDGYTVFNYPISLQNGWNYVKKQLNDNRDYIYNMDTQSAEAYVNSEYAVAITELEV